MEKEITAITLDNPSLSLPNTSYGFSNEPLSDNQIKIGNNRDIYKSQFFALDVFWSSGTGDNTYRDVLSQYMGENKKGAKAMVAPILSWLGSITYSATLNYSTDYFGSYVILVPPTGILEINSIFYASTESVRIWTTGSMRYLKWNSLDMSNTNSHIILINNWTTHNKITLKYATSASDIPRFWVFMKVIY